MEHAYGMNYGIFLKLMRTGRNVSLEQLGWGLCSTSMLSRIEEGGRLPCKMMRDRLTDRLGVSNDGFEDYLQPDEYALWKTRQELLCAIEKKELDMAEGIIRQYEENGAESDVVERQFYLAMKAQLLQYRGASDGELRAVLKCAIKLTMPESSRWKERRLAAQEWNLLLEYIRYGGDVGQIPEGKEEDTYKAAAYENMLEAIQETVMDPYNCAKIYPKAAYYLCLELMNKPKADWDCDRLLRVSERAVEILRSTERLYYMSEVLEIEEQALVSLTEQCRIATVGIKGLLSTLEQVREWRKVLGEVYRDAGVSEKMENDCHLYWQTQNYCLGDVVQRRRKMLGMSVKELCEGICTERTLRRLESGKMKTQKEIVGELLERLGLPAEYTRRRIVTEKYEAIALYDDVIKAVTNRDTETLARILPQLREILSMDLMVNRQEMEFLETLYQYYSKQITDKECVCRMEQVLEYTIPLECIRYMDREGGYFSCGELTYLFNIATRSPEEDRRIYIKILWQICEEFEKENGIKAHINVYELIMRSIASNLGDLGEYERSNEISDRIMRESLSMGRMGMLASCLYNKWWNHNEYQSEDTSAEKEFVTVWELQKCIQLARLCKDELFEKFYREKLKILHTI